MSYELFKVIKGDYFDQYPEDIQNSSDPDFRGLADKINELRTELVDRFKGRGLDLTIEDLETFYIPEQSPEKILPYISDMIGYDYDKSKTIRELRAGVFKQPSRNKRVGTLGLLKDSIQDITGIRPDVTIPSGAVITGWDQNSSVDGNPETVDFFGGIGWDQNSDYIESGQIQDFRWFISIGLAFIDIKNDGIFNLDPLENQKLLDSVYKIVSKYKDASVGVVVGYVDSVTGQSIGLKYIYSRSIMSNTDVLPPGSINNTDNGIEF